jgi:hypothetical protein
LKESDVDVTEIVKQLLVASEAIFNRNKLGTDPKWAVKLMEALSYFMYVQVDVLETVGNNAFANGEISHAISKLEFWQTIQKSVNVLIENKFSKDTLAATKDVVNSH